MKRYFTILALMVICLPGYSQKNVNQLFKEFSKMENVTHINMGKITMKFASVFTDTFGVDGIQVYAFDECGDEVKGRLLKAVSQLKDASYETMVSANESGSKTRVLVKIEDEMISELVIITVGDSNALVRIKGKVKPEDVDRLVNQNKKRGC